MSAAPFVVYGKAPGLEYSVRTAEGEAVCTCAYNPNKGGEDLHRQNWARVITEALNLYAAAGKVEVTLQKGAA